MMMPEIQSIPLITALEQIGPHDHLCSIYGSQEEHFAVAIPFIRIGLDRGEKCIYIVDDGAEDSVRQAMYAEGIDVERATASKSLVLTAKDQSYLKRGSFDLDWMFTFWKDATEAAKNEGFTALRATGETGWVLSGCPKFENWIEYESRVTHTLAQNNGLALCQYDRRIFAPEVILEVIRTHPIVVYRGKVCKNLYYVPPEEFLSSNRAEREVERILTNIRESERVESELRSHQKELQQAQAILVEDINQRKHAEAQLLGLKEELATELTAMTRLHEFSTRLLASTDLEPLLEEVLNATIELQNADFGNVQLYNPETQALEIVAQRGFQSDFLDYFRSVPDDGAASGRALRHRERVIIEDVQTDPGFEPHRQIAASAGFRAVQSTPLFSRTGEPLGVFSTHFRQPHRPSERDLRLTDLYITQAAEMIERNQAKTVLQQAFEEINNLKERLHHENVALREEVDRTSMFEEIVGSSPVVKSVLCRVAKVAPMNSTVLITGETGTGKELIARAIHKRSKRAGRAFIAFNCAGVPPTLIASELFGHEKGAFTGAQQRRLGRFELAAGGTIFLDEIGELPAETQIALLRVLQEREFERVGGCQPLAIDVRVIAASNRDLQDAIRASTFRLDLFHRLNVFPIEVPPLRERKEDIPMLLEYFIKRYAVKAGKIIRSIDKKTVELFKSYSWPGNIRELQNVIERSIILCETETFSVDPSWLSAAPVQSNRNSSTLGEKLHEQERKIIESALAESKGRIAGRSGAAAKLGIPSSTLESKIKLLRIKKNGFKPD
jgi:transcriptional regulator with GAF, ATPase, and Fis domain